MSPTYRNDRNGDVVTVEGDRAKRLDSLPNWHRIADPKPDKKDEDKNGEGKKDE